ncbi:MAG: zinc ABC transporter substrate-binding protein [Bacteroidales bacterium]|nr:zinc ABC transporter substrate-binding protein [Bacteroidales bacterium]
MNVIIRQYSLIVFRIAVVFLYVGCGHQEEITEKQVISVSILPQKFFIEKIAGDRFIINVLVPPGMAPENYDPAPQDIVKLSRSEVYFKIGLLEFEEELAGVAQENNPELRIFDHSYRINLLDNHACSGHEHNHNNSVLKEPHIWMSPGNVRTIIREITEVLISIDNADSAYYFNNFTQFDKLLAELDENIHERYNSAGKKPFIIYHPALSYYAKDYGLDQVSIEEDGKEPGVYQMKNVIDLADSLDIRILFIQEQFSNEIAKSVAKEAGLQIIRINPLSYDWIEQIEIVTNALTEQK